MEYPPPVIVLPGVTGTQLRDEYQLPPDIVWSVLRHEYARIILHPDNPRYEATQPARIQPDNVFDIAYKELVQELRYNLRQQEDKAVPVFLFGYDWRQPLELIVGQFAQFVDEVIERTKLLRHYAEDGYADDPKVNLVGHSMGGLIIAGYLEEKGKAARVAKVATLATPFHGSFEAVIKIATGTANLGSEPSGSREREAARLTPSLYYLMPDIDQGLEVDDDSLPKSLFDPGIWQPGVIASIEEFVRLHAVSTKAKKDQARTLFGALLKAGEAYRLRVNNFKLTKAGLKPEDWLCVAGVNSETRVRLKIQKVGGSPLFDLGSDFRLNLWAKSPGDMADRSLTGDGTVPFESAIPPFLKPENIICVTPDDFGYWEVQDKVLSGVAGFHGIIPNMDMLHRLIVRHFTGRPDKGGNTWGRPAPGITEEKWQPPMELRLKS
jgi:pimeloyl-ACP methyl ester carboxylesterase